jgi:hypothetical protein
MQANSFVPKVFEERRPEQRITRDKSRRLIHMQPEEMEVATIVPPADMTNLDFDVRTPLLIVNSHLPYLPFFARR